MAHCQCIATQYNFLPTKIECSVSTYPVTTRVVTTMPSSVENYDFHDQIGHLLRRAYQRHVAIFQDAIPDPELTIAQFVALCAIRDAEGSSLNDIVKSTAIDQGTIRGIVERLKARGLVQVTADPADGRKLILRTTAPGLATVNRVIPVARQVTTDTFGSLNPGEQVALAFLLRKMIGIAEPH